MSGYVDELRSLLGADAVLTDVQAREQSSRDFSWLSPILTRDLPKVIADVVVRPASTDVIEAGCSFDQLDEVLGAYRRELPVFPSSSNSTVGGFLSGGNQGVGSIEHGRRERTALIASFPELRSAAACGRESIDADRCDLLRSMVAAHGAEVVSVERSGVMAIAKSVYNHTALHLRRKRPDVIAVQIRGNAIIEEERQVRRTFPDVAIHLDGNAPRQHGKGFSGLLFSRWVDDATLQGGMERLRGLGVRVINPHTWLVGSHGGLEAYWSASAENDPLGLLNPGKLPDPAKAAMWAHMNAARSDFSTRYPAPRTDAGDHTDTEGSTS